MLMVCAVWGVNFSMMKFALRPSSRSPSPAVRFTVASAVLWLVAKRLEPDVRGPRPHRLGPPRARRDREHPVSGGVHARALGNHRGQQLPPHRKHAPHDGRGGARARRGEDHQASGRGDRDRDRSAWRSWSSATAAKSASRSRRWQAICSPSSRCSAGPSSRTGCGRSAPTCPRFRWRRSPRSAARRDCSWPGGGTWRCTTGSAVSAATWGAVAYSTLLSIVLCYVIWNQSVSLIGRQPHLALQHLDAAVRHVRRGRSCWANGRRDPAAGRAADPRERGGDDALRTGGRAGSDLRGRRVNTDKGRLLIAHE